MKINIKHRCSDFDSYRATRCKSLFNVESGCNFNLDVDIPIDDDEWCIGLVVGPSGSGKTSIGKEIFGMDAFYDFEDWPHDKPIIDVIGKDKPFDDTTAALAGVGLGDVPAWLRPYNVLSNGEKFRANLAKIICDAPDKVVIDEFTSVVDRQIAKVGAHAFSKNWKRAQKDGVKKCVLLSCHYDIIDWLEPDWVYDIATGKYQGRGLWRRPEIKLEVYQTNWRFWEFFRPHHYLKVGPMPASNVYLGVVDGSLVCHAGVAPKPRGKRGVETRAARWVVLPEWQGTGIGVSFANFIAELQMSGDGVMNGRKVTMTGATSHPGVAAALRRSKLWQQITCETHGQTRKYAKDTAFKGFAGHFRSIQGFRYIGKNPKKKDITTKFRARR